MTLEPIPYATREAGPEFPGNRRVGLIVFGVVSLLIGGFFILGTAGTLLVLFQLRTAAFAMPWFAVVIGAFCAAYAALAALFVSVGVGSIRCRRWVRPVVLAFGWPTVVSSVLVLAWMVLYAADEARVSGRSATAFAEEILVGMCFIAFVGVIVPGAYVWFYSTANVRRTLAAYDARPSWTERNPMPVFVACACLMGGGLLTVALSAFNAVPAFGTYVTGVPAVLLAVGAGLAMVAAAVLMHLGLVTGWWLALGVVAGGFASAVVTFGRLGVLEFYRRGGTGESELVELGQYPSLSGVTPIGLAVVVMAISVGVLLWVRKGVGRPRDGADGDAYPLPT